MLSAFGWLYAKIINQRNLLYEKGSLRSSSLGVPTISIGNITVGGTGKTPLVALVAEILAEKGETVGIISRGYKRKNEKERVLVSDGKKILADAETAGDEPLELALKLKGKAFVIADADRVAAGNWAREEFGITAFVLDDAFQHLKVRRDLDIVTVDATNPFGNGKTLPAGILREPLDNLNRADLIIITRANLVDDTLEIQREIRRYHQTVPILISYNQTDHFTELKDQNKITNPTTKLKNQKFLAFCALGNPANFFDQLTREKFPIVATEKFSDHHFYSAKDIKRLENRAVLNKAEALLTTAKDAVKLKDLSFSMPCYVSQSRMIFDDEKRLREIIRAV